MDQVEYLRKYVKNVLLKIRNEQKRNLQLENREEFYLRKLIRKMFVETKTDYDYWVIWPKTSINNKLNEVKETAPHESTGINLLAKLLDNIIPVIETGYKSLTTDIIQRKSFRAHVLKATQNLLSTASVYFDDDDKNSKEKAQTITPEKQIELKEEESEVDPKKKMFIDINQDKKDKEKQDAKDPENAFQPIEGEDTTGRAFALETFKKIQKQTLESYQLLSNLDDRKKFYKFLITNLGLYFDQFEDELKTIVAEPTTKEYEAEKAKKNAELSAGGDESEVTGAETADAATPAAAPELEEPSLQPEV